MIGTNAGFPLLEITSDAREEVGRLNARTQAELRKHTHRRIQQGTWSGRRRVPFTRSLSLGCFASSWRHIRPRLTTEVRCSPGRGEAAAVLARLPALVD